MSARDAARRLAEAYRDSGALWTASLVADRVLPLGTMRFWKDVHVPLAELRAQVDAILAAWGMAAEARATTLEHLLYADLHGIDSHGSAMLRAYQREHTAGQWRADAAPSVVQESDTTALVDGGGGLGHVPADTAMRLERVFGTSAEFWIRLQASYDLEVARRALAKKIAAETTPIAA